MMKLGLICLLSCVSVVNVTGESDVIGSHEPIEVTKGDDAILPCHLEPPFDVKNLTVEWKRNGTKVHRYRSRKDDLVDQDEHFKGRTFLFHDEMAKGNISLKLTNVNERDEGNYTCFVPKLHSQVKRGKVTLKVNLTVEPVDESNKGNRNSDTDTEEPTGNGTTTANVNVGAIVGAIVGGVVVGAIVGAIAGVCVVTRRKRRIIAGNGPTTANVKVGAIVGAIVGGVVGGGVVGGVLYWRKKE